MIELLWLISAFDTDVVVEHLQNKFVPVIIFIIATREKKKHCLVKSILIVKHFLVNAEDYINKSMQ